MLSLKTKHKHNSTASFTLVELLIVIALLAILASAIVIVINPGEILANSRDSVRIRDLGNLNRAINLLRVQCPDCSLGASNTIYVSIPSDFSNCANLGLPPLPHPWVYSCVPSLNLRNINGTGWMPINFTASPAITPLSFLPIDPVNSLENGQFYIYTTEAGRWKLTSLFESERHARSMNTDGGPNTALYEVGSNLNIANFQRGLVGQWSFEDGTGTTVSDTSGRGNTGTLHTGTIPIPNPCPDGHRVPGVIGQAICFDGVDDFVRIPHNTILNPSIFTIEAWVNPVTSAVEQSILTNHIIGVRWESISFTNLSFIFNTSNSGVTRQTLPFPVVPAGRWTHLVAVYNGVQMKVYQNGTIIAGPMSATGVPWSNPGTFSIGAMESTIIPPAAYEFHGPIDEVRIHNRALSASEVRASFNAGRQN